MLKDDSIILGKKKITTKKAMYKSQQNVSFQKSQSLLGKAIIITNPNTSLPVIMKICNFH